MFDRFDLFMTIAGVVMVPFCILYLSVLILLAKVYVTEAFDPDFHLTHIPLLVLTFGVQVLVYDLSSVIGQGAITEAVSQIYVGERPEAIECLAKAWRRKWSLIGSSLIVYGSLFVGMMPVYLSITLAIFYPNAFVITLVVLVTIIFLAGFVYSYFGVVLTSPAVMVEGFISPMKGVKRSWELCTGSRCYLVSILFSLWFLTQLLSRLLQNMFVMGGIQDALFSFVGVAATVVPIALSFPMHAILQTVLYLNLRVGRESMNHQVLSGDLANDASPASRFRNDDPGAPTISEDSLDYRHIPLMDAGDDVASTPQHQEQTLSFA